MKKIIIAIGLAGIVAMSGCSREATIASHNLSQAADNFQIDRRVIFYNGITDKYILTIKGKCNIYADRTDRQLEVTCKVGPDQYKKHYLGLSDNVTYFVEQLYTKNVNAYHYTVTFMPQSIIPDVDFRGDVGGLQKAVTPDYSD